LSLAVVLVFSNGIRAQDMDWPQFRGPTTQGTSTAKGLPTEWSATKNIAWKTELPGPGTSSPIVIGSKIYLTCYRGYNVPGQPRGDESNLRLLLVCLQRDNGLVLWTKEVTPRLPEQASIREGHGYASSTPAADSERLYVFFGKTGVLAFDHDGKQLWQTEVGSKLNGWGSAASLLLYNDLVIVNASVESDSLVALDKKTGKEVWRTGGIRESWNMPIVAKTANGEPELVVAIMGKILGLKPTTGEQLWSCNTDIGWYMVPSLVAHDGVVYCIGGRSGGGLAVRLGGRGNVTPSHRLWTSRKGSNVSSPLYHEGHLYFAHEALGVVYCCDAKTGNVVYEERIPGASQIYASPVLADGKIYYPSRPGRTFVVAAQPKYALLATNDLEPRGMFNASPAISGSSVLLRSDRYLYCVGGK
jgi:outer membrane protein assembly factor BamB